MVGQSNGSSRKSPSGKEKKNCGCTPSLINRSMNNGRAKRNGWQQQTLTLALGCTREDTEEQNERGGKREP
jgi:hypothetical protein